MPLTANTVSTTSVQGILRTYPGARQGGIPKRCRCGCDIALHTTHDGRKFFECTGNTMDGQAHLKTWWEEAITEQFDELYDELDDINTQLRLIAMDCGTFEKLFQDLAVLKESEKRELKSATDFKLVVACGIVVLLLAALISLFK